MSSFSKLFLLATFGILVLYPVVGNMLGWGIDGERDASIIAKANECPAERLLADGKCLQPLRSVHNRRSIFGGSYGHGK